MSTGPFDDPHLDAAWRAYAEEDRRLAPPAEFEQLTLARAVAGERKRATVQRPRWMATAGLGIAASIAMTIFLSRPQVEPPAVRPIEAQGAVITELAGTVAADRPRIAVAPVRSDVAPVLEAYVQHVELPDALMQFDTGPLQAHEPLQMVRLRLPLEALQALGLALFELDASGVVDVDVVIGEDGLPRDIRQVRIGQEQR